jgi:hypothetical protein
VEAEAQRGGDGEDLGQGALAVKPEAPRKKPGFSRPRLLSRSEEWAAQNTKE